MKVSDCATSLIVFDKSSEFSEYIASANAPTPGKTTKFEFNIVSLEDVISAFMPI